MTLAQLRVFIAVAERQHLTRAAESLHIAQSAVSASIAALEAEHDAALFDRVGRGIRLTDAGRRFLIEARAVLASADQASRVLARCSRSAARGPAREDGQTDAREPLGGVPA